MCKLYGSGTHRCRDKKEHQFIAMEARARARAPHAQAARPRARGATDARVRVAAGGHNAGRAAQSARAAALQPRYNLRGAPAHASRRGRSAAHG